MGKWKTIGLSIFAVWIIIAVIGSAFDTPQTFNMNSPYIQFMMIKAGIALLAALTLGLARR